MFWASAVPSWDIVLRQSEPVSHLTNRDTAIKLCLTEWHNLANLSSLDNTSFRKMRRKLPVTKTQRERGELLKAAAQFTAVVTASCEIFGAKQQLWGFQHLLIWLLPINPTLTPLPQDLWLWFHKTGNRYFACYPSKKWHKQNKPKPTTSVTTWWEMLNSLPTPCWFKLALKYYSQADLMLGQVSSIFPQSA